MAEPGAAGRSVAGIVAGAVALLLPLIGLVLLLTNPGLDVSWENHPAHFWLVFATAAVAAGLAYATGEAAVQRGDARVLEVSLTFLSSAGFLALHALATPGVVLDASNLGFQLATPVGIALGSAFAVISCVDVPPDRVAAQVRLGRWLRRGLLALMALWCGWSLAGLAPLDRPPTSAEGLTTALAVVSIVLYGLSAARYAQLWWRHPAVVLLAMLSAFVLLAEAMVAIALADNWHLAWWEWHLLMLAAFVLVALGARASWREERFADLYLPATTSGTRDISVLFADLQGFTTFSEAHHPDEVTAMLNAYFAATVPAVVTPHGGEVDRIVGDALMVVFNKRGDQPDHARRAAAAGLALQAAATRVHAEHPDWPQFRVGINSGPVAVSLLGAAGGRTHTIIGDVVNTASRIEGQAPAGGVAIGADTKVLVPEATTSPLGPLHLKGKAETVEAHLLLDLPDLPDR